jgi:hypothetical protein
MSRVVPLPASNTVVDSTVSIINADGSVASIGGTAASPTVVVGNVASDAVDSGAGVKVAGVFANPPASVAAGDRVDLLMTATGEAGTAPSLLASSGADAVTNTIGFWKRMGQGVTSNAILAAIAQHVFNGTTWDRERKPNISKRIASSAASGNPDFLKASAGDLVQAWGQNGAAITYLQVYNKASAPTIGSDTPILTYPIAALERFNILIPGGGYYFATGIAYAFTTDAAATTGASAAAVTSCNIIGA